jgi:hypothetical protein
MTVLYIPKNDREEGILDGVIDIHCHSGPCIFQKDFDEIELARQMRNAGYRGVMFKQHLLGANRIDFVRQAVPGIEIFGGIALNHYAGGLNPFGVAACILYGGKEVKFPNIHAQHHMDVFGGGSYSAIGISHRGGSEMEAALNEITKGITVFDEKGGLLPEVHMILEMAAQADIGVETGHLSPKEQLALIKAAKEKGVKKIWVTHANWHTLLGCSVEDIVELANLGAFIEVAAAFAVSSYQSENQIEFTAEIVKNVGPHRCILASDFGTGGRYNPVEAMRIFIRAMMRHGIKKDAIDMMAKENPAVVLGL